MTDKVNGATVDIKFNEKTVDQLVEIHNEMALTAHDFGLVAEPVANFGSASEGIAACERLHGQILAARERAAAPEKKRAIKSKKAKVKKAEVEAKTESVVAAEPTTQKETTVAKKTKKAKGVRKAAKAGNGARKYSAKYPLDAKITWTAEGNPARKDTIFYDRVEKIRKAKTIESALKSGGTQADARECAKREWCKIAGGTRASA